jgi:hypothetical protein
MPGAMRPSSPLWQRLYLRPEPHQQSSLDWGRTIGALARVRGVDSEPFIAHHSTHPSLSATLEYGYRLAAAIFQSGELLPLGGVVAVDVGDEVCSAVDVEADFATRRHWGDDGVGDGLSSYEVQV